MKKLMGLWQAMRQPAGNYHKFMNKVQKKRRQSAKQEKYLAIGRGCDIMKKLMGLWQAMRQPAG